MTDGEAGDLARAAILILAASLIRYGWAHRSPPPLLPDVPTIGAELLAETERLTLEEERARTPLAAGERLDPNRAPELELRRLPGIGPATARRIVEERTAGGGFTTVRDLERVQGVGPATVSRLEPFLDLSAGIPPELGRGRAPPGAGSDRVDVNVADEVELQTLPGIGPALARRLVEYRNRAGPFRAVEELLEVPGVGPAILERLRPLILVRP